MLARKQSDLSKIDFFQLNNKQAHFQSKLLKIEQNNLVAKCKGGFRC